MDEKNMLDKIKKSADRLDIPDSLKPEQIVPKVQYSSPQKRSMKYIFRAGGIAAALLLLMVAVRQVYYIDSPAEPGSYNSSPSVRPGETESDENDEEEVSTGTNENIIHAKSYDEIYQALSEQASGLDLAQSEELYLEEESLDDTAGWAEDSAGGEGGSLKDAEIEYAPGAADLAGESQAPAAEESSISNGAGEDLEYSETNIQELGVDEADIIKTDGRYIYIIKESKLYIIRAIKGVMEITATLKLPNLSETVEEMYVDGDTLNLIASGYSTSFEDEDRFLYEMNSSQYVKLYTLNIEDRTNIEVEASVTQEGWYRDSRKNGNYIYLFSEYMPEIMEHQEDSRFIPQVEGENLCLDDIYLPKILESSNYLLVTSVDITEPDKTVDRKGIVSAAHMFYVSTENIYICNSNWTGSTNTTQIMKFHYEDGKFEADAAAEVPGILNNSFSMNEYEGNLRIVTTKWSGDRESNGLYILDQDMEVCGSITDLAPGETIESARFIGDTGYFVTFKQIDPLFSVDLADPRNPVILGELKITGFSSYLHFYGKDRLLGIGNEVDPDTGEYLGVKLSMFDISDPTNVTESGKYVLEDIYDCPGLYNYKAVLIDPEKNILGFWAEDSYMVFYYDEEDGFVNAFTFDLYAVDEYSYYNYYDTRGIYIGNTLYLCGNSSIWAFDMSADFEEIGTADLG